jgi:hypothetical protein
MTVIPEEITTSSQGMETVSSSETSACIYHTTSVTSHKTAIFRAVTHCTGTIVCDLTKTSQLHDKCRSKNWNVYYCYQSNTYGLTVSGSWIVFKPFTPSSSFKLRSHSFLISPGSQNPFRFVGLQLLFVLSWFSLSTFRKPPISFTSYSDR